MVKSVDQPNLPGFDPGVEGSQEELLSDAEEAAIDRLVDGGVTNYQGAREIIHGTGHMATESTVEIETEEEPVQIRKSRSQDSFPLGPKRKMRPRTRAWGEKASSDDGQTPLNN